MTMLRFEDIKNYVCGDLVELELTYMPGKTIYLKPMSAKKQIEVQGLARNLKTAEDELAFKKGCLQAAIANDNSTLMFDLKNIDNFMELDCRVVNQVYDKIIELNFPKTEDIEKTAKN